MRHSHKYLLLLAGAIALAACSKHERVIVYSDGLISMGSVDVQSTKGYLNRGDLDQSGTRLKVYDALSGLSGSMVIGDNTVDTSKPFLYIDDEIEYNGGTIWPYRSGEEYRWTRTGTHHFFGWLTYDAKSGISTSSFFGSAPTLETDPDADDFLTMTTPTLSFTPSTTQYDFLYTDLITRAASAQDYSTVQSLCSHMFTAVSLTFENKTDGSDIRITEVNTLYDDNGEEVDLFPNSGYATVDYSGGSGTAPKAQYHLQSDKNHPFFSNSTMGVVGKTVAQGHRFDMFTGTDITGTTGQETYYMMWPLDKDIISPRKTIGEDIFGDPIYDPANYILQLGYQVGSEPVDTARIMFPYKSWNAGSRIQLNIEFTDKVIEIKADTLWWDYNEHLMDFNSESITTTSTGKLMAEYIDASQWENTSTIALTTTHPTATCKVEISSLKGAHLVVSKIGPDPDYFEIDPSVITITGGVLRFVVRPSSLPTGGIKRKIQLSFSVDLGFREIDGNAELIDSDRNYTFTRL